MKIIFTLVLLICINLTPSGAWPAYLLFLTSLFSLILLSQLGLRFILTRSLISIPFVLAAIPLVFTGPDPFIQFIKIGELPIVISQPGFVRFVSIAIKSWISILAAILLSTTTSFPLLLSSFRSLGIPKVFVSILGLMWRYLFLIIDEVSRLMRARASRSAAAIGNNHSGGSVFWRGEVTGKMAGNLLLRSLERSDRVYAAMCSRGYNGEPLQINKKSIKKPEALFLAGAIVTLTLILLLGFFTQA